MTTVNQIIARAATFGVEAVMWQKGEKLRIYVKRPQRGMKVFLDLDGTPEQVEGAVFKSWCDTEQHINWQLSQGRKARENFIGLWHSYVIEMYKHVGPAPNGFGADINNMIDTARAFEATVTAPEEADQ